MQPPDDTPVLILTGPPGAGKTTAARVLAGRSARATSRDSQPLADPPVVERLWHDFADLGPMWPHAVDVEAEDPDATADLLEARIRDGSLRA